MTIDELLALSQDAKQRLGGQVQVFRRSEDDDLGCDPDEVVELSGFQFETVYAYEIRGSGPFYTTNPEVAGPNAIPLVVMVAV